MRSIRSNGQDLTTCQTPRSKLLLPRKCYSAINACPHVHTWIHAIITPTTSTHTLWFMTWQYLVLPQHIELGATDDGVSFSPIYLSRTSSPLWSLCRQIPSWSVWLAQAPCLPRVFTFPIAIRSPIYCTLPSIVKIWWHRDSIPMRLLLHYVAYKRSLFSKWHLPILSPISAGSLSILSHPKISP